MNNLDMKSKDMTVSAKEIIKNLFPSCFVNDNLDFLKLKQELSNCILDESKEKYELTWPGKKKSLLECNRITTNTLIPQKQKSQNYENTKNLYIEGDNLEALKILQESYLNKVKLIYIDPPYNTGHDFLYNDDYTNTINQELESSGQKVDGIKLISNTDSNGRFHSDWLSMMYSRIKLARNLLSDDGAIFISIDDNELKNLMSVCDEIFGSSNFVANVIWQMRYSVSNDVQWFSSNTENIIIYAKNKTIWRPNQEPRTPEMNSSYKNPDNDPRGPWASVAAQAKSGGLTLKYPIMTPSGKEVYPPEGRYWAYSKETYEKLLKDNRIYFSTPESRPRIKKFLSEVKNGKTPQTLWTFDMVGHTQDARRELDNLMNASTFETPKPTKLIKKIIELSTNIKSNDIVLDFFSGSATTAHAVMQLNSEDGGNRKFIMIQIPELCDTKTNTYQAGYKTICELGEERIRRAGKKIKDETNADIDYGFRVYKVDSSNMKDVFYKPSDITQLNILDMASNIKEDRTAEDLLTQVILDLGLTLDLKIEEKNIINNKVYFVETNALIACFDDNVDIEIIDEICKYNPLKVVFKDISFKSDKDKINLEERIKKLSPETEISIL